MRLMGAAAAAASFLLTAPVSAAETHSNVKPAGLTATNQTGYFSGLETVMIEKDDDAILAPATIKEGFAETENGVFFYDAFGQKVTGLLEEDGKTYLFDDEGKMQTGLQKVDGVTYLFSEEDGSMQTGESKLGDKTYFLQEDGALLTGWQEKDGKKYYYNEDGSKIKNTVKEIDGNRYSFNADGVMEVNVSKDGYQYGADGIGKAIPKPAAKTAAASGTATAAASAKTAAAPVANAGSYQAIANAALAQLGRYQDCTMLVTNSLAAVGINFHGWPTEYLSLGPTTSNPVPGDICVYQGHVAIYIGNGQAVHGGWLGSQTVISTVACDRPFIAYVHPILP